MFGVFLDLHVIPKRILTGVPAQHLYQEISRTESALIQQMKRLNDLEIQKYFLICSPDAVNTLLGTVSNSKSHSGTETQQMCLEKNYWFPIKKNPIPHKQILDKMFGKMA